MKKEGNRAYSFYHFAILMLILLVFTDIVTAQYRCKPRPMLVETTNHEIIMTPSFVSVHRCQGGIRPGEYHCQPDSKTMLKVKAKDFDGKAKFLKISNHTSCKEVCVCGRCEKRYKEKPYCEVPLVWNSQRCKCETMGVCTTINKNEVAASGGLSFTAVALLMLAEILVLAIGVGIVTKWWLPRKKMKKHSKLLSAPVSKTGQITMTDLVFEWIRFREFVRFLAIKTNITPQEVDV